MSCLFAMLYTTRTVPARPRLSPQPSLSSIRENSCQCPDHHHHTSPPTHATPFPAPFEIHACRVWSVPTPWRPALMWGCCLALRCNQSSRSRLVTPSPHPTSICITMTPHLPRVKQPHPHTGTLFSFKTSLRRHSKTRELIILLGRPGPFGHLPSRLR
jgi:hypothetical protein